MQTADGSTLNLNALCAKPTPSPSTPNANAKVAVSNLSYDGNFLTGTVTNQTGQTVNSATVDYQVLDNQGKEIDSGFIKVQGLPIPPGGSAPFHKTLAHPGAKVQTISVDWQY